MDYPRMRRSLFWIRARRQTRAILDASGFGPSTLGRLCLVLIFSAVLFGGSLVLSLALHESAVYGVIKSVTILVVAFIPFLVLVLGPSDEELATQLDYTTAHLPAAKAAWTEHTDRLAADRLAAERLRREPEREDDRDEQDQRERAQAHPQVVVVAPTKDVGVSLILTILFGPLGMLYSTVAGGLIMMVVSVFVALFTCGFGLLITYPLCIVWGALAASSYNRKLLRRQRPY